MRAVPARSTLLIAALAVVALVGMAATPPDADARAQLKPKVGWGPLKSGAAKRKVSKTKWEPRPRNYAANHRVPTREELRLFRANSDMPYAARVNGRYRGTTDDIIEWAAIKWGLPEDLLRAVAVHETWWDGHFVGDDGDSFGIFQVRRPYHCCLPFMRDSTAFNADYYGAILRAYYDGKQGWLNTVERNGDYGPGDLWGSVGVWASGRWHLGSSDSYVAQVQQRMRERPWFGRWF